MLTELLAARAAGTPAIASAHTRTPIFLRTPSLREGGGHGWLRLRRAGLLEDRLALRARPQDDHDDCGEKGSGPGCDLPQPEGVPELALQHGAEGVHDPEGDHVQAE